MTAMEQDKPHSSDALEPADASNLPQDPMESESIGQPKGQQLTVDAPPLEVRMGGIGLKNAIDRSPFDKVRTDMGPEWGEAVG